MDFKHIATNLYYIGGPIFGFYIADGEKQTLIELGVSQVVPNLAEMAKKHLGRFNPGVLVGTHSHFDHIGGAVRLKDMFPDAVLCGSAATDAALRDPENVKLYIQSMENVTGNPGFEFSFPDADEELVWRECCLDRVLRDGDTIPLEDGTGLSVLETPGHSDCSITLFHEPTRTVFASDAVGVPLPSGRIWVCAFADFDQYKKSMERILDLEPEHLMITHVPPFLSKRAPRYIERSLKATESFFARIRELYDKLGEPRDVVHALVEEYEYDMPFTQANVFRWGCWEMVKQVAREDSRK